MISDDSVQVEGVQCMLKVCKEELLGAEEGVYLMHNVLCILYKKAVTLENAKIAILTCPFEAPKPKTKHNIDITSA